MQMALWAAWRLSRGPESVLGCRATRAPMYPTEILTQQGFYFLVDFGDVDVAIHDLTLLIDEDHRG